MKERPIILPGHEVRGVMSGIRTQLRRPVDMYKPRAPIGFLGGVGDEDDPESWGYFFDGPDHHGYMVLARGLNVRRNHGSISIRCPFGEAGERLWVRETWGLHAPFDLTDWLRGSIDEDDATENDIEYRADWASVHESAVWRSPVAMPRWASRITLEITEVRVQRLRAVTEADARAEGYRGFHGGCGQSIPGPPVDARDAREQALTATAKLRAIWEENPWTWAISFSRVSAH